MDALVDPESRGVSLWCCQAAASAGSGWLVAGGVCRACGRGAWRTGRRCVVGLGKSGWRCYAPNAMGNFCFEVTLGYRRLERGR